MQTYIKQNWTKQWQHMSNTKYNFVALLRERETKTIKTVAFCKKLYFKSK